MMKFIIASLAYIGLAQASCPNSCSGKGTCGIDDVVSASIPVEPPFPIVNLSTQRSAQLDYLPSILLLIKNTSKSAPVIQDGAWPDNQVAIAPTAFVPMSWPGSMDHLSLALYTTTPNAPTKDRATAFLESVPAFQDMKERDVAATRVPTIALAKELASI
jgi:hypothetical protein